MPREGSLKNKATTILLEIGLISIILCLVIVFIFVLFGPDRQTVENNEKIYKEKQSAVEIVQSWQLPKNKLTSTDMTCKEFIDLTVSGVNVAVKKYAELSGREKPDDTVAYWSATKEDDAGNYIVRVDIHDESGSLVYSWRVYLPSKKITPLDAETICPSSAHY